MSDPIDDKALDEYLKGGSPVSQRYRELDAADVPPELDRHVLAQARAAVSDRREARKAAKSRAWMRWSAPVALAASVVTAVAIVIDTGVQDHTAATHVDVRTQPSSQVRLLAPEMEKKAEEETPREVPQGMRDEPVPYLPSPEAGTAARFTRPPETRPAAQQLRSQERLKSRAEEVEQVVVTESSLREQRQNAAAAISTDSAPMVGVAPQTHAWTGPIPSVAPARVIAPVPPVAAPMPRQDADRSDVSEIVVTGNSVRRAPRRGAGPRGSVPTAGPARAPADEADADATAAHPAPEEWLAEIRRLREAGKARAADREWRRFRDAYPDFPVADSDPARRPE